MNPIKIAIVGFGKIARDQHVPALAASSSFELSAVASPDGTLEGLPGFTDIRAMVQALPDLEAVVLCTPPQARQEIAHYALERGLHVLLEKSPGKTVSEVLELRDLATQKRLALLASWHSRHASAVDSARTWLGARTIYSGVVNWKEDVRVWHPGQTWIWRAGGLGVFDPGINGLSILTHIIPGPLVLRESELCYPRNRETPISARLLLATATGAPVRMELDFLQPGEPSWDIEIDTDAGRLTLSRGGSVMTLDGRPVSTPRGAEYPSLYAHFAQLVHTRRIDVDLAPLQLVADAFLCGRRVEVESFV
jgi:D-galactose 1-dehydrogenase